MTNEGGGGSTSDTIPHDILEAICTVPVHATFLLHKLISNQENLLWVGLSDIVRNESDEGD